jgi:hypothetical protein
VTCDEQEEAGSTAARINHEIIEIFGNFPSEMPENLVNASII